MKTVGTHPVENPDHSGSEPHGNVLELTVSELSFAIKRAIEDGFSYVRVRGELGRVVRPASGHVYLDLKDEKAVLSGIIWRGQAAKLKVQPEQGMEVIATGRLTTYPGQSRYQIVIEALEPAGEGALLAQLEKLKKKLSGEGLFDEDRKKPIPFLPRVVGIVTSPSGAVIRDMLHGFTERFPVHVLLWPVRVQGETCGAEVAAAIRGFNALTEGGSVPRPDVLIVGRGGGSLEDLWGFNAEEVARAAADSAIPLISAVGHETDWTLIDWIADARAPTPTKAAEWAVPVLADLLERLRESHLRLGIALRRSLDQHRVALKAAARGLPKLSDLLALPRQRFDSVSDRLPRALTAGTRAHATRFARAAARLRPGMLVQKTRQARERLERYGERSGRALRHGIESRCSTLDAVADRLPRALLVSTQVHETRLTRAAARLRPGMLVQKTRQARESLTRNGERSLRALRHAVESRRRLLNGRAQLLSSLGHHSVLARGFVLVRDGEGEMLRSAQSVSVGDSLDLEFSDGHVAATAVKRRGLKSATRAPKRGESGEGPQGSLF
ncbi:MAG TPA: exodeoxyribonuclease VII large subunit [Rhizobiales bacterium]|nr:exodeoxyribonuclease 7 large subunit [bacterium BMS3Bbin10]HDO51341.1 exodeoxyribonuclease VII large subunit [Hyphomicrobiales bacterium]